MEWQLDASPSPSPSPLASLESVFAGDGAWDVDLLSEVSLLLQPLEARDAALSDDDEEEEEEADEMGDDDLAILNQLLTTHNGNIPQPQQHTVDIDSQPETALIPANAGRTRTTEDENEQLPSVATVDVEEMQFTGRTTRERRRQELAFLRTKALELEAKLAQHRQRRQQEAEAPQSEGRNRQSRYAALWMKLAKRQEKERRLAQTENAKLRQLVVAQVRLARSLDRVLRKRMVRLLFVCLIEDDREFNMRTPAQQPSLSVGGSAWGAPVDVVLLHEVAALLSPNPSPSGTSISSSGGFVSLLSAQHPPSSSELLATSSSSAQHLDTDAELAAINELLDAQLQQTNYRHYQQNQFELPMSPVVVRVPPPPARAGPVVAPRDASASLTAPLSVVLQPPAITSRNKPTPKTTRERQKEELMELRVQAAELEAQLENHKQLHRAIIVAPIAPPQQQQHGASDNDKASSWWAKAADHQLTEKCRAEEENNRLRDMALGQLRLAKSLEKVLEKRRMWEDAGQPHKRPRLVSLHDDDNGSNDNNSDTDASIFASLKSALGRRGDGVGDAVTALFKEQKLDTLMEDTVDVDIKNNSNAKSAINPMHVNLKFVKLLPFDFRVVGDATWQYIQRELLDQKHFGGSCVVEKSDHQVATKLVVAPRAILPALTTRSVFQRFLEADRVVFQYETLTESGQQQGSAFPLIRYREQGWLTISAIRVPSAAVASATRQFTRITPADNAKSHTQGRGVFMDLLIALQLQNVHEAHEAIMDILIDAQIASNARPPSSHSNPGGNTITTSTSQEHS